MTEIYRWDVDELLRSHPHRACLSAGVGAALVLRGADASNATAVLIYDPVANFETLGKGDIVLLDHHSQGLLVHTLVKLTTLKSGAWISAGSANLFYDEGTVTRANFRGRVEHIYKIKS